MKRNEIVGVIVFFLGAALIECGLALWSKPLAFVAGGILAIAIAERIITKG